MVGVIDSSPGPGEGEPASLFLASKSPRRRELLHQAGIAPRLVATDIDDSDLCAGCGCALSWVMALAYLKARAGLDQPLQSGSAENEHPPASPAPGVLIGADTLCVLDGATIGKPATRDAARNMIRSFMGRTHDVVTGVCLIDTNTRERDIFAVRAEVTLGELSAADLDQYLDSEAWRGKAGGYNLTDRIAEGWPVSCSGDETAVVGLPMHELRRRLAPRLSLSA